MKTALIGLGRIGWQYHLPQIVKHEGFELAAVVDTNPERLREAEVAYGVRGYADAAEMLAKEAPELVVVASPTVFHRQHAMDALRAGAHVFLDKPMACSLSEAREIGRPREGVRSETDGISAAQSHGGGRRGASGAGKRAAGAGVYDQARQQRLQPPRRLAGRSRRTGGGACCPTTARITSISCCISPAACRRRFAAGACAR